MSSFKKIVPVATAFIFLLGSVFASAQISSSSLSNSSSSSGNFSSSSLGRCNGQAVVPVISPDNLPPQVDFTTDLQGPTVFVDARISSDPNGDKLRYSIQFDNEKTIGQSNAWHTFRSAGDYTITVTAFDGEFFATHSQIIAVTEYVSGNRAPIAMVAIDAGPNGIKADSRASFDEDGDALTYSFSFDQRDPIVSSNPAASTSHNGVPVPVVVTVTDGGLGDTREILAPAPCNWWIDNMGIPVIDYRVEGATVYVDARNSKHTVSVGWNFGDGAVSSDLVTSHTYAAPGDYDLTLRASSFFFSGSKTIRISVGELENNAPPGVAFECRNETIGDQLTTLCSGDGTYDADGTPLIFTIDWGNGSSSIIDWDNNGPSPLDASETSHVYSAAGTYTITLTVFDGLHTVTKEVVHQIPDTPTNQPPVACFTVIQNAILPPPLNAWFDAGCSTDPDGDTLSYTWEFGDGSSATGINPSHTFAAPGSYSTTLAVSDGVDTRSITQTNNYGPVGVYAAAKCEYLVSNDWGSGFTGVIRVTNYGSAALEGWNMSWQYSGSTRITNLWNAELSGTNPYIARNLDWNKKIQPGQSVEFGFQGSKAPGSAEVPVIKSDICKQ